MLKILLTALLVALSVTVSRGRAVRSWSYEELYRMADVVVVIESIKTEQTKDKWTEFDHGHPLNHFQAWSTTFKLHTVFKGSLDLKDEPKVLHFSYSEHVKMVDNGANFAKFPIGPCEREIVVKKNSKDFRTMRDYQYKPVWLAFLRRLPDGRLVSVTDQYDSQLSFKELSDRPLY